MPRLYCSAAAVSSNDEWNWKLNTLQRMLLFMGPALIIPLGDPLMTLTDTVFIGQVRGRVCLHQLWLAVQGSPSKVHSSCTFDESQLLYRV